MQKASIYFTLTFLLFILSYTFINAQYGIKNEQLRINQLTTDNGLPQNTVDCILKDSRGFIWFGTWNGLCRFDGYNFKTFQKQQNIGLPGNFIYTICEDFDGNLWAGTEEGLAFFNSQTMQFELLPELKETVGTFSITHIQTESTGAIWVGTEENGLWKIQKNAAKKYKAEKIYSELLPSESINHFIFTSDNYVLIGTEGGLAHISLNKSENNKDWGSATSTLNSYPIQILFEDEQKNIWIGTVTEGLYYYEPNTNQLSYFGTSTNGTTNLNHLAIRAIIEDLNGNIIIGTLGGLNFFDRTSNSFSHKTDNKQAEHSLNSPFVNSMYADDLGNIWIGTDKGGVNFYNSHQKPFNSIQHNPANENSISHNTINSLFIEKDVVWVGTAGGGLNKVKGNKITKFQFEANNPKSINSDFVTSIYRDKQNKLWVGTWGGGLNRLVSENLNNFEILVNLPRNPTTLCNSFISCIEPLNDQQLLIGTGGGLDIFNPTDETFLHVHEKMNLSNTLAVGCLLTDKNNRVWIGTENGLYRFDKNDLNNFSKKTSNIRFDKFINHPEDSSSLAGDYVISLFEASDGSIWIGTYGNGICKFVDDNVNAQFINYSEEHGLCNNVAYGIEEDIEGNLWISTDNGLAKFNSNTNTFKDYYESDGLRSNQFYWSASSTHINGTLYFGGIEGVNHFSPTQIEPYPNTPQPVFTEFSIFSNPVNIGEKYHSQIILTKPISETKQINLSYKDAVFSIEFSALDYFLPEKIKYAYKMEGVDQDWVEVPSSRRFANYTNLSGGKYIFKIKAANSDGIWNETPTALIINIKPPFWETTWFQVLTILFIVLLVAAYIRSRTRFLKEQKRKLEQQVRDRTQQIEEQNQELEKQNEKIVKQRDEVIELNEKVKLVNQLRLRFFTNISHEFRTPLTLIIDPLEQLMQNLKSDENTHNTLGIINRNAQRLLHLINQLLYFRRVETGKLKLNVSKGNLVKYVNGIFNSFKDLAEHQQINYQFVSDEITDETWFDAEKIENVFYNLLSNAFKHTPTSGYIRLKIKIEKENRDECIQSPYIFISVNDTGEGIPQKHLPHIFDRFYKAEENNADTDFISSGIGLALSYEIVKALHGEIKVVSQLGKGSSFTVCIPYTKERFADEEINEAVAPAQTNIEGRVNILTENIIAEQKGYETEIEEQKDKSKPTILIAEDNFDLRNFLLQTLRTDYRVIGAENGKIGLDMAKKFSPELIISDVMMPEMDGIEMCSRLKNNIQTSHIPIVLLTAKNMVESWIEGLETGADDYISKPFNLQILQVKMRNLIESRRKIKRMFSSPEPISPNEFSPNKLDEEFISKAYKILEKNYTEAHFSVEQFAKEMFVSQSLLYKKIKALTDLSITDFVNSYKLKKAVAQIKTTQNSISEIAFNVGFNDPKYFSRIFKKFYGMSPSQFSKKNTTR